MQINYKHFFNVNYPKPKNMKNSLLILFCFSFSIFDVNAQQISSREGVTIPTLEINLYARAMNGSMFLADGILQNFNNNYSAVVDNMDVRKFMNATDNLAIKNGSYNLIVERRPDICIADTLQLMLTGLRVAPYRFEIDPSVLHYPNIKPFLIDKFLRTETPVSLTAVTSITFDITTNPQSSVANRFMMVYRMHDPVRFTSITAVRNTDNSITILYKTENENNVNSYIVERSLDGIRFEPVGLQTPTANNFGNPYYNYLDTRANSSFNWYRIKAILMSGEPVFSDMAKADMAQKPLESKISIFPNPVRNGKINISFENKLFGLYRLSIINNTGQLVHAETLNVQNVLLSKTINKPDLKAGVYRLITENAQGEKNAITLVIQ